MHQASSRPHSRDLRGPRRRLRQPRPRPLRRGATPPTPRKGVKQMIPTIAPLVLDSVAAIHVTTVAAPIWDIGANLKNQGITFAVNLLMGGTALVAAGYYFIAKNKTAALKTLAVGVVLIGLVGSLPALGVVSKDTIGGLTNTGTR